MRHAATIASLAAILALMLASPALAQELRAPGEGAKASGAEPRTEAVTGEKVEILLRSGVPINGVSKGHRVEILDGKRYIPSTDRKAKNAGIRVYYALGLNGYIFVPYSSVDEIRFRGFLSKKEGQQIAKSLEDDQTKAEKDRARAIADLLAKKAAKAESESSDAEKSGVKPKAAGATSGDPLASISDPSRMIKIRALLKKFPPDKWKPSRLDDIKRRAIILDVQPSSEESAFMDGYDLWLEGYRLWKAAKSKAETVTEAEEGAEAKATKPDAAKMRGNR
ncbi:MAG: hypothetical protein ACYTDY_16085 [Planctomycetota bacterium]|jgi:hypothetical protein